MSSSVWKQSLELLQENLTHDDSEEEVPTTKKNKTKSAMKLISTRRKGVWKELRRLQKQELEKSRSKHGKKLDLKSKIEKYQEDELVSRKAKNAPLPVVKNPRHMKNAQKVFEYHIKNLNKRNQKEDTKKEETTVFTDRDFDKFEEEYDFWNA